MGNRLYRVRIFDRDVLLWGPSGVDLLAEFKAYARRVATSPDDAREQLMDAIDFGPRFATSEIGIEAARTVRLFGLDTPDCEIDGLIHQAFLVHLSWSRRLLPVDGMNDRVPLVDLTLVEAPRPTQRRGVDSRACREMRPHHGHDSVT
jgi:hypothetical protein